MKKKLMILIISILAVILTACGLEDQDLSSGSDSETEEIEIQHELGETKVMKNPKKVVVFDYGSLDTLDKLDIEVAGIPRGNMPSYLEKYDNDDFDNVGSLKEPDFESLSGIDPDLIIISGRQSALYEELSNIAPTIYLAVDRTNYMDSFKENLATIGVIFDNESEIEEQVEEIEASIDSLKAKAEESEKNGLIILANDDKISAYGPSSRFGLIHDVLGVPAVDEKIEASTHGMNVSFEYVLKNDPDLLYVIDRGAVVSGESSAKQVVENKLVKQTQAYPDNIIYLDPSYWYLSGGGLISVTEMIKEISDSLD